MIIERISFMQKYNTNSNRTDVSGRAIKTAFKWIVVTLAAGLGGAIATPTSAAEAKENWGHYCARCHGPDGTANTKMGRKLRIKDLSSEKMQTKLSDEDIVEIGRAHV